MSWALLLAFPGVAQENSAPTFANYSSDVWTVSSSGLSLSVTENTTGKIGDPVVAQDSDDDNLTYSLTGADDMPFAIDGATGQVSVTGTLDYESGTTSYSFSVAASDGNGGTASVSVSLTIVDESEPPPAPEAPTVTAVSATEISASWEHPGTAGRPPITGYDVRVSYDNAEYRTFSTSASETAASIGELDELPVRTYSVEVLAENAEGKSGWSEAGSGTNDVYPKFNKSHVLYPEVFGPTAPFVVGKTVWFEMIGASGGNGDPKYYLRPQGSSWGDPKPTAAELGIEVYLSSDGRPHLSATPKRSTDSRSYYWVVHDSDENDYDYANRGDRSKYPVYDYDVLLEAQWIDPATVTSLKAIRGIGSLTLEWDDPDDPGIDSYEWMKDGYFNRRGPFLPSDTVKSCVEEAGEEKCVLRYTLGGLTDGVPVSVQIRAHTAGYRTKDAFPGRSEWSNKAAATPGDTTPSFDGISVARKGWIVDLEIDSFTIPEAAGGDESVSYKIAGLPDGVGMDTSTRLVSGTPTALGSGTATVTATDVDEDAGTLTFDWQVGEGNSPPSFSTYSSSVWTIDAQTGALSYDLPEDAAGDFADPVVARDADGDDLTYGLDGGGLFAIDGETGQISVTGKLDYESEPASHGFTVTAEDSGGATAAVDVTIVVADADEPPLAPPAPRVTSLSATALRVDWSAPDNSGRPEIIDYDLRYSPDGATWTLHLGYENTRHRTDEIEGLETGTEYQVQVRADNDEGEGAWSESGRGTPSDGTDGDGTDDDDLRPDFPPTAVVGDLKLVVGSETRTELPQAEGGNPPLSYGLSPAPPPGLAFDADSRILSGEPVVVRSETRYTYTVTDADGDQASLTFDLSVEGAPVGGTETPTFGGSTIGDQLFTVGASVRLELPAATGGDGPLSYSLTPSPPPGLSFDSSSRVLWGTPVAASASATYTYAATDGGSPSPGRAALTFAVVVEAAPVVTGEEEVAAAPAGQTSVALVVRGEWADRLREGAVIEVRGLTHEWMEWRPGPASSAASASGVPAASSGGATAVLIDGLAPESPYTFRLRGTTAEGEPTYSPVASAMTGSFGRDCAAGSRRLCMQDRRFEVQVQWANPHAEDDFGRGATLPVSSSDESGLFWFFNRENVELAFKVLDGSSINGHYWVFFGALTDVEYWLTVNDTVGGGTRTYYNPPRRICGQRDTWAFQALAGVESSMAARSVVPEGVALPAADSDSPAWWKAPGVAGVDLVNVNAVSIEVPDVDGAVARSTVSGAPCEESEERLCLGDRRFAVEVEYVDPNAADESSRLRRGKVVPSLTTLESGLFWFFNPANFELVVKVLDGRSINGSFWFLYGGLSDVEYRITVTDTMTGTQRTYTNESGSICGEIDIDALTSP